MDKKMKDRVLKAANAKHVKADMWLWVKITFACIAGIVLSLVFTPQIADYVDSWHPYTQLGVTLGFVLIAFLFIKRITK